MIDVSKIESGSLLITVYMRQTKFTLINYMKYRLGFAVQACYMLAQVSQIISTSAALPTRQSLLLIHMLIFNIDVADLSVQERICGTGKAHDQCKQGSHTVSKTERKFK